MTRPPGESVTPPPAPVLAEYIRIGMEHFKASGEPYVCHIPETETLDMYAALLGLEDLQGRTILDHYYQYPHASDIDDDSHEPFLLERPGTVDEVLQDIGTSHGGLADYPNDFIVGIAIQADDTTAVCFGLESEEIVGLCADCDAGGYDDAFHGCGHAEDRVMNKGWLIICAVGDLDEIDWERGDIY